MRYDFKCDRCGNVQEVVLSMKEVTEVPVYCNRCSPENEPTPTENWSRMRRQYSFSDGITGTVTKTIGSMLDKNKKNARPKEWFNEQNRLLQQQNAEITRNELKIAGKLDEVNKKRSQMGFDTL